MKRLLRACGLILGLSLPVLSAPSGPPAGNYIQNISTNATQQIFSVSSGTVSGQLTVGSCQLSGGGSCGSGGSSGASTLAITAGVSRSSPTTDAIFPSSQFVGNISGSSMTVTLSPSSATLQGNIFNGNNQLVQTNNSGQLPAINGTNLVNLPGANIVGTIPAAAMSNAILNQSTLQSGSTFYVASGTVSGALEIGNPSSYGINLNPASGTQAEAFSVPSNVHSGPGGAINFGFGASISENYSASGIDSLRMSGTTVNIASGPVPIGNYVSISTTGLVTSYSSRATSNTDFAGNYLTSAVQGITEAFPGNPGLGQQMNGVFGLAVNTGTLTQVGADYSGGFFQAQDTTAGQVNGIASFDQMAAQGHAPAYIGTEGEAEWISNYQGGIDTTTLIIGGYFNDIIENASGVPISSGTAYDLYLPQKVGHGSAGNSWALYSIDPDSSTFVGLVYMTSATLSGTLSSAKIVGNSNLTPIPFTDNGPIFGSYYGQMSSTGTEIAGLNGFVTQTSTAFLSSEAIGANGNCTDLSSGAVECVGVQGSTNGNGTAPKYVGVLGLGQWTSSLTHGTTSQIIGVEADAESFKADGLTANATGQLINLLITQRIGGDYTNSFAIDDISTDPVVMNGAATINGGINTGNIIANGSLTLTGGTGDVLSTPQFAYLALGDGQSSTAGVDVQGVSASGNGFMRGVVSSNIVWNNSISTWSVQNNFGNDYAAMYFDNGGGFGFSNSNSMSPPQNITNTTFVGNTKMYLTNAGNLGVGVGLTSPSYTFQVKASTAQAFMAAFGTASGGPYVDISTTSVLNFEDLTTSGTLSSCGTGGGGFIGGPAALTITPGTSSTGCTYTFPVGAFKAVPICQATPQTGSITNTFSYSYSATSITVTETGLGTGKVDIHCTGRD